MAERAEIDWWFHGSRTIFPDHWETFAAFVPEAERGDLLSAYYRRLTGPDREQQLAAAIALRTFSGKPRPSCPMPSMSRP